MGLNFIIYLGGTMKLGFTYYASNYISAIFSGDKLNEWFLDTGTRLSFWHPSTWIPTLLILAFLMCLTGGLLISFDKIETGVIAALLMLMAFSARVIMGFSPTVWASGIRPFFVTYMIIVMLILMLLNETRKILDRKNDAMVFIISTIGISTFILTFFNR